MKRLLTYLLVTFTPFGFAVAQVTDSTKTVISLEAIKVLYQGLENPVRVAVPGVDSGVIYISAKNCRVTKKEGNLFSIKPIRRGKTTIYVSVKNSDTTKLIDSVEYEVKKVPLPRARLGKLESGSILYLPYRKGDLDSVNIVTADGFVFEGFEYEVLEYFLVISPPENSEDSAFVVSIKGKTLPPHVEERFNHIKQGYIIIIDNIKARGPGGVRVFPPIVIEVRKRTY